MSKIKLQYAQQIVLQIYLQIVLTQKIYLQIVLTQQNDLQLELQVVSSICKYHVHCNLLCKPIHAQ